MKSQLQDIDANSCKNEIKGTGPSAVIMIDDIAINYSVDSSSLLNPTQLRPSIQNDCYKSEEKGDCSKNEGEVVQDMHHQGDSVNRDLSQLLRIRRRNAMYSKRKYYKKKRNLEQLCSTKYRLEINNQVLRIENEQLEQLIREAKQLVQTSNSNVKSLSDSTIPHSQVISTSASPAAAIQPKDSLLSLPSLMQRTQGLASPVSYQSTSEFLKQSVVSNIAIESLNTSTVEPFLSLSPEKHSLNVTSCSVRSAMSRQALQEEKMSLIEKLALNLSFQAKNRPIATFLPLQCRIGTNNHSAEITSQTTNVVKSLDRSSLTSFLAKYSSQNNANTLVLPTCKMVPECNTYNCDKEKVNIGTIPINNTFNLGDYVHQLLQQQNQHTVNSMDPNFPAINWINHLELSSNMVRQLEVIHKQNAINALEQIASAQHQVRNSVLHNDITDAVVFQSYLSMLKQNKTH